MAVEPDEAALASTSYQVRHVDNKRWFHHYCSNNCKLIIQTHSLIATLSRTDITGSTTVLPISLQVTPLATDTVRIGEMAVEPDEAALASTSYQVRHVDNKRWFHHYCSNNCKLIIQTHSLIATLSRTDITGSTTVLPISLQVTPLATDTVRIGEMAVEPDEAALASTSYQVRHVDNKRWFHHYCSNNCKLIIQTHSLIATLSRTDITGSTTVLPISLQVTPLATDTVRIGEMAVEPDEAALASTSYQVRHVDNKRWFHHYCSNNCKLIIQTHSLIATLSRIDITGSTTVLPISLQVTPLAADTVRIGEMAVEPNEAALASTSYQVRHVDKRWLHRYCSNNCKLII